MSGLLLAAALLALADASAGPGYEALVARGVAAGREGRLDDAGRLFDEALEVDPRRPEAYVERGGLHFLRKDYESAVRDLSRALSIRDEAYTRDLLAASLALLGRTDEALDHWNALGQPRLRYLDLKGLARTRDRVARREISVEEGETLDVDSLRASRLRLQEVGVFDRVTLRPVPRGQGEADLEAAFVERHGLYTTPVEFLTAAVANALGERVRLRYANIGGTGTSLSGQYRWNSNRPEVSLGLEWPRPFGLPAYLRVQSFRGRQVYEIDEPLTRRSRGADVSLRRVLGAWTVGQVGLRLRHRTYSRADPAAPDGAVVGIEVALERRLLEAHRHRIDASLRVFHATRRLGSDLDYARSVIGITYRAHLSVADGLALDPSTLAAQVRIGYGTGDTPLDEMFAPGVSQEMELPLRAHRQTRRGALGRMPIGRSVALLNLEWRRRLVAKPALQLGFVGFFDGTTTGRIVSDLPRHFADAGLGLRLSLGGGTVLRLDWGHGLIDGKNAISAGVGQAF